MTTAKTTKKTTTMRPFSTTPIVGHLTARNAPWGVAASSLMLWRPDVFPLWLGIPLLVLFTGLWFWLVFGFHGHRRFVAVLKELHRELRWFDADAVTWFRPDQLDELRTALAARQVVVHELAGATIRSVTDLQADLQQRFGSRTWPKDPAANAAVILAQMATRRGGVHALLWHDASVFAQHDPEGHARFVARWTTAMAQATPHVLLFLAKPMPLPAPTVPTEDPAPVAAAPAPDAAWWKARPGELAN